MGGFGEPFSFGFLFGTRWVVLTLLSPFCFRKNLALCELQILLGGVIHCNSGLFSGVVGSVPAQTQHTAWTCIALIA